MMSVGCTLSAVFNGMQSGDVDGEAAGSVRLLPGKGPSDQLVMDLAVLGRSTEAVQELLGRVNDVEVPLWLCL